MFKERPQQFLTPNEPGIHELSSAREIIEEGINTGAWDTLSWQQGVVLTERHKEEGPIPTQEQLGQEMGLSHSRIPQIEAMGLRNLRRGIYAEVGRLRREKREAEEKEQFEQEVVSGTEHERTDYARKIFREQLEAIGLDNYLKHYITKAYWSGQIRDFDHLLQMRDSELKSIPLIGKKKLGEIRQRVPKPQDQT